MKAGTLRLIESRVDGILPDGRGGEAEAEFGVRAQVMGGKAELYKLVAMTLPRYETWYLSVIEEGRLAEGEARPLVVPDAVLAVTGLVDHVRREYLDPATPDRINMIVSCLELVDLADNSAQLAP